jgi:hypothetical protein
MLKGLVVLVFLLIVSNADAQSKRHNQPQSPPLTELSKHPPSQNSQKDGAQEERASEKSPAIVKRLPAEKPKDELDREIAKQESDRQLVKFTGDLATYTKLLFIATGILAVITAGLVIVGFLQVRDAKESISAAVKSAAAAEKAANAAEAQTAIIGAQTDIITKQHAVGRLQFLATHRPRLRIRHVTIVDGSHIGHPTIFFSHGEDVKGSLTVVNIGGTKAIIIDSRYRIYFSKQGLPIATYFDETFPNLLLPGHALDVGESCAIVIADKIVMDPPRPGDGMELRAFERDSWVIYVMGQIRYQDEGGADRFIGFCRIRGGDGRFRAVNDPDYEYED